MIRTRDGAAAGVVAVGLALAVSELAAGLIDGVPSLVSAVAAALIPLVPVWLEQAAIELFGTSDKGVLTAGTIILTLAVGAWTGSLGARDRRAIPLAFGALAVVGLVAALLQPQETVLPVLVVIGLATAAGIVALHRLLAAAEAHADALESDAGRRRFLLIAGGIGASAVAMGAVGRRLLRTGGGPAPTLTLPAPQRTVPTPRRAEAFAVDGLTPVVVPNEDFYRIDVNLLPPSIDAAGWSLTVRGMVDRETVLSYDDLSAMRTVESYVTLACVSNEVGGDLVGNARWLGVPLRDVLDLAGVQPGASQVVGRAVDGWTAGFPTELALDGRDALVAIGMNGEPLPAEHGFPARLVVPGLYGYVSATKWLTEIELTTWEGFDGFWIPRGWAKQGPIKTQSRIDVPRRGEHPAPGDVTVAGVAWAPTRGVAAVELQVDDGPWEPCVVSEPLSSAAWVQWKIVVALAPGAHTVRVRAVDGAGEVQTATTSPPRPDGATGYHTRSLQVG